jgi:8-oxo-dGTP pyrophosphatase MutT (NUDIX family)
VFGKKKKRLDLKKIAASAKAAHEKAGRIAHDVTSPLMKAYLKEGHVRVRTLILNEFDEVLLVRSWFGHQKWSLPGGGIQRVEKPVEAAVRETYEETGIRVGIDDVEELGSFTNPDAKKPYTIACFRLRIPKREPHLARHRRLEMLDVSWFPLNALPAERSATVDVAVSMNK